MLDIIGRLPFTRRGLSGLPVYNQDSSMVLGLAGMVHSSFISHYLHNINMERKVLQQMITRLKYSTNYKMCVVVKVAKAF